MWQTIDSAPKCKAGHPVRVLVTRYPFTGKMPLKLAMLKTQGWYIARHKKLRFEPTHWMPYPDPPNESNIEDA